MKVYNCRMCNGKLSEPKLQFPPTPLANEFVKTTEAQEVFPLEVCVCEECCHYQLNESISPERLFRNYLFVAGTSPVNVEHFKRYAEDMVSKCSLKSSDKVLDIASNDGTLLQHFKNMGFDVLGIDPAKNIADEANKKGIETIPEFFTNDFADTILEKHGKFNLITANNVFAHVPDLEDFALGVKKLLTDDGVFSFEVSYFKAVCENLLFDTIYHEHSSYHTINPLMKFFKKLGMKLFDFQHIDTHGGSIRVFVKLYDESTDKCRLIDMYQPYEDMPDKVKRLQKDIKLLGYELREKLEDIKSQGKMVAIYGTPAKATTLMYALGLDRSMFWFAVDDAPLKQGAYTPGMHIPVLHPDEIRRKKPDYVLVLAWNFADSIIKNHAEVAEYGGKWIVPIPELKVI